MSAFERFGHLDDIQNEASQARVDNVDVGPIDHKRIAEELDIIEEVISKGFCPCRKVKIVKLKEEFAGIKVPEGSAAIFSVASVPLDRPYSA